MTATHGDLKIPPPKSFSGKDDAIEFENYSRQLKAYMSLRDPRIKALMVAAETSPTPLGMPADPNDIPLAVVLQNILILTCDDRAQRIVFRDDSDENGFESWRRLYLRYAPTKRVKYLGSIQRILTWKFSEATLEQDLNDWEAEVDKYERGSSQKITDDVRIGVLMFGCPTPIQHHLQLTTTLTSTFAEVRDLILNYCKTRLLTRGPSTTRRDDPTEIGAI